jgi:hypothetical protein
MGSEDYLLSIGDLVDKLSIENIKCYHSNHYILEERKKTDPSAEVIASLEFNARKAGEQRCRLKHEINVRIKEAIERGTIDCDPEVRTYDLRGAI